MSTNYRINPEMIEKADKIYKENFPLITRFERAIFVSWYCSIGDCTFCYMSTQQEKISEPRKARRKLEGVLAEAYLCAKLGWEIEFISGGVESYTMDELEELLRYVYLITGKKQWLNIGIMGRDRLERFKPFLEGVTGTIETVNPEIHKIVCPSKPVKPIEFMFDSAGQIGLKKAMTIIIGLGESIEDFPLLDEFIRKHNVSRIIFYALNPIKGTPFEGKQGPEIEYFVEWIARTRIAFSKLEIIAGIWVSRVDYTGLILKAGANYLTKFPALKLFGSEHARAFVKNAEKERKFLGTLTELPEMELSEIDRMDIPISLREKTKAKISEYVKMIRKKNSLLTVNSDGNF